MNDVIQTNVNLDTEPKTDEIVDNQNDGGKTPEPKTNDPKQPSLADVLALLKEAGEENLLALEPVKALVETVRKQEKDKLYKTIEQKEKEAKELKEKYDAAQESLKKYEEQNLSFEEKLQLQIEALRQEHEALVEALKKEKEEAERKAHEAELQAYKEQRLREVGDEIIVELVGGNTKEEIDTSIERAIAKYQEIASRFEEKMKEDKKQAVKAATKVTNPSANAVKPITAEEIARMSPEEYAKNRDRIMEVIRLGILQ